MASALAVPFKEILINNEKINISETEKKIGSINCIYRKKISFMELILMELLDIIQSENLEK